VRKIVVRKSIQRSEIKTPPSLPAITALVSEALPACIDFRTTSVIANLKNIFKPLI